MLKIFWCHLAKMPKYCFCLQSEAVVFIDTVVFYQAFLHQGPITLQ